MIVGLFAVSAVLRHMAHEQPALALTTVRIGSIFGGVWEMAKRYPWQILRGSALGTIVGMLPGAGADIAAWLSYAMSKRFSREPDKFGTGHPEGLVEAGASNNSALGGAWIPALVFGIPGDTITAIAIGVLYMKNMNPGPSIFIKSPENVYALFLVFILANLLMVPLGWVMIRLATNVLKVSRNILMPSILVVAMVGSFAINNSLFDVGVMLAFGLMGFVFEENGFPLAPAILGLVLGAMLEESFINSMIMADGNLVGLVNRPIAAVLAVITIGMIGWSIISALRASPRNSAIVANDL
jgi:TctA family transporter